MSSYQLKSGIDDIERKIVGHIGESYNQFIISANENLSSLIQSSIGHSNDIINMIKNEVTGIRNMCIENDTEGKSTDVNAGRFQFQSALDGLERKIVDHIGESYNQFIVSVNENLSSLIQSSIGHSSDIIDIIKHKVTEIRNMFNVDDKEAKITDVNSGAPKFLILRPISELKEGCPKEDQYQPEQQSELAEPPSETPKKGKANVENVGHSTNENNSSWNGATSNVANQTIHSCDRCDFTTKIEYQFLVHLADHTRKRYQCDRCDYESKNEKSLSQHLESCDHSKLKFKCDKCTYAYKEAKLLEKHKKNSHDFSTGYDCQICLKIFPTKHHLRKHYCPSRT